MATKERKERKDENDQGATTQAESKRVNWARNNAAEERGSYAFILVFLYSFVALRFICPLTFLRALRGLDQT